MYKIQWSHHTEEEATWETEDYLNRQYPGFLSSTSGTFISVPPSFIQSRDEILFKGLGYDTLVVEKSIIDTLEELVKLMSGQTIIKWRQKTNENQTQILVSNCEGK